MTTRSRPQVIFNHLPGSLLYDDAQGLLGRVIHVDGKTDSTIDVNRLTERIRTEIERWKHGAEGNAGQVNPDVGFVQPSDIEIIRPERVEWSVFPYYFRCRSSTCGIWQYKEDLSKNQGRCHRCAATVEQTPFVWVHHCGYLTALAPGQGAHCSKHREKLLYLHDTGTFTTSSWRCRDCGHQAQIGFLQCPQCNSTSPRPQPMKWNDPGVYSSVTFEMVNLNQEMRQRVYVAPNRDNTIVRVISGKLPAGVGSVLQAINSLGRCCQSCGQPASDKAVFCDKCGTKLPSDDKSPYVEEHIFSPDVLDDLVTYTLLWDLPGTSSLQSREIWNPIDSYGIADIVHMERFPISLIGLGYRRQRSKRPATLCLFTPVNNAKVLRVFTNSMDVEAMSFRMDANSVLIWLFDNGFIEEHDQGNTGQEQIGLNFLHALMNQHQHVSQIVIGLLHSISHAYIIGLSWCSGMDLSSFSETILPGVLTSIVHAGDTSIGGLSSVFFQAPWQPLEMAREDLIACQLDPSCSQDDGGACVACLHLPLGCSKWNSELSRAYLYGGQTKDGFTIRRGFWQGRK